MKLHSLDEFGHKNFILIIMGEMNKMDEFLISKMKLTTKTKLTHG
jgi:hypothetical protein